MVRHVALFRWQPETTAVQVAAVAAALATLPAAVGTIADYRFGADLHLVDDSWDFAVVADFADVDDWRIYRDHPAHLQVIAEQIRPLTAQRAAVQYRG